MRGFTTAFTVVLVAAVLTGPLCCRAEDNDASTASTAPADGSRFGNARPATAAARSPPPPPPAAATPEPPAPPPVAVPTRESAPTTAAPLRTLANAPAAPLPAAAASNPEVSANVLRSVGAPPPVPVPAASVKSSRSIGGWNMSPNTQYHIQTDEGPERYFKYQTISGQYRKEKRLQDGTVVGTYGWVDPNGFLRLRDYVADNAGYRVLKTKMVFVGKDEPISNAVSKAKHVPSQGGSAYVPPLSTAPATTPAPVYTQPPLYSSNPLYSSSKYATPPASNSLAAAAYYNDLEARRFDNFNFGYRLPQAPFPQYDGISATHNGFRYYLPRQYHEEETLPQQQRSGSFGYIDPFGIRRVIYYNTAPGSGFVHRKNNRYVGFNATPYDPRF